MNYKIYSIPVFDKQFKRLFKKYPSLKNDLNIFVTNLIIDPLQESISLGNGFYKYRMAISSKEKGRSGGARIIAYLKIIAGVIYLTSIYDKSEKESISDKELIKLYKQITDI